MSLKSFKELKCWQHGKKLRSDFRELIATFLADEKFDLYSQMRRASRAVTHNIAEGYGRYHDKENVQFCRMSRASLNELQDQIDCALDEGYINQDRAEQFDKQIEETIRILNGYIKYLNGRNPK
jgi:four helix bundle protein